jgi:hypothetical protein
LDSGAGIVEEGEQHVITLSLGIRPNWLSEDSSNLLGVQVAHRGLIHPLCRNARNLCALRDCQRLVTRYKGEKAVDGRQSTVTGANRDFTVVLKVLQEREYFTGPQVGQRQYGDVSMFTLRDEAQEQSPGVTVRQHCMTRQISLLAHPFVEERMQ